MGAPILSAVPASAWYKQGFDDEEQKRNQSRAEKRKQLQELADRAAAEGRELNSDEWFRMAQAELGPASILNSSAPTADLIEQVRLSSNERARQVSQQRNFEKMQQSLKMEDELEKRVESMSRSGRGEGEIVANITELYGPDYAKRFAPRISAIAQRAALADTDQGMRLGGTLSTVKEAEEYVQKYGAAMTPAMKEGVMRTAKAREDASQQKLAEVGVAIGGPGFDANDPSLDARIKGFLAATPHLNTPENVAKIKEMATSNARDALRTGTWKVQQAGQTAWAQAAPNVPIQEAEVATRQDEIARKNAAAAQEQAKLQIASRAKSALGGLPDPSKIKDKALQGQYVQVENFLSSYDVDPEDARRIVAAVNGKGDVAGAIESARKNAVPLARISAAINEVEQAKAGIGFSGDAWTDYGRVAMIGAAPDIMAERGNRIRTLQARGNTALANQQLSDAVSKTAQAVEMTRSVLIQSGRFGATPEQVAQLELAALTKHLEPLAAASGLALQQLVTLARSQMSPPSAISARPSILEGYRKAVGAGQGQAGLMSPSGVPGYALPQPSVSPQMPMAPSVSPQMPGLPTGGPVDYRTERGLVGSGIVTPQQEAEAKLGGGANVEPTPENLARLQAALQTERSPDTRAAILAEMVRLAAMMNGSKRLTGAGAF
jgi:hypothetical protein